MLGELSLEDELRAANDQIEELLSTPTVDAVGSASTVAQAVFTFQGDLCQVQGVGFPSSTALVAQVLRALARMMS